ncbi:MAG TPA: DUF3987 domain-containing protein [Bacteroidia bacterium]
MDIIKSTAPNEIINIIPDRTTAPRIIERISNGWNSSVPQIVNGQVVIGGALDHTSLIVSTELQVLLTASDWMLTFLTDTWDRHDYEYDTKNKGTHTIKSMCNSFIAATVPNFIQNINKNINLPVSGGFTSRCLFIYADQRARYLPFPPALESNPQSVSIMQGIKNDLQHISYNLKGEYTCNTEARVKFENFLKIVDITNDMDSEPVANFRGRIKTHTLKLAMILAAARKDSLIIEGIDMDNAILYIKAVFKDLEKIFRGTGESELAIPMGKIQTYLEKVGISSKQSMLKHLRNYVTIETLDRCLWLLEYTSVCETSSVGKTTMWRLRNGSKP